MKHNVYVVFDQAAGAFLPPWCMHSDAMASRVFGDCVNSKDHQFAAHPGDYSLYRVGEFHDSNAQLVATIPIHLVTTGLMSKVGSSGVGNGDLFPELGEQETAIVRHLEERGGDL